MATLGWRALGVSLALGLATTACGSKIGDLCERSCECEGCDVGECEDQAEALEDAASKAGCGSEFDDFIDCVDDSGECVDGNFETADECEDFFESCGG
jgi:hypothetical protein